MARFVLKYEKKEDARWLSHLDVLRAFERALRRSELPVAYTEGFNPRPKLWFAAPIGVGVTGQAELAAFDLDVPIDSEEVAERIAAALPEGFAARGAWPIDVKRAPFPPDTVNRMALDLGVPEGVSEADFRGGMSRLMAEPAIEIAREKEGRRKTIDIRPRIAALELVRFADEAATVAVDLIQTNEFGVRPAEFVSALGRFVPGIELLSAHRIEIGMKGGDTYCRER